MSKGKGSHQYGKSRPSGDGQYNIHVLTSKHTRDTHYRPLPKPTGAPPFELDVADIVDPDTLSDITNAKKITFHVNGDMGGVKFAVPQMLVAQGMEDDFKHSATPADNPAFLYLLGDCVYFNGEIDQYRAQFYEPYQHYLAPIFAVPGNHDGENLPTDTTLDGFVRFFCDDSAQLLPEAGDTGRTTMIQPNVYWTLRTPLVNIVGLYSNVPEGGDIRSPQIEWIAQQFQSLSTDVPLLLTLHHPIYSADVFHSGSTHMKNLLEQIFQETSRHPDMVLAGHVHNYQRVTRKLEQDRIIPYVVSGAGGYHHLHAIIKVNDEKLITPTVFEDKEGEQVVLEKYCDDHHGFLRLEVTETTITGRYYSVPRPHESYSKGSTLIDYFEYDWKAHRYIPNSLLACCN